MWSGPEFGIPQGKSHAELTLLVIAKGRLVVGLLLRAERRALLDVRGPAGDVLVEARDVLREDRGVRLGFLDGSLAQIALRRSTPRYQLQKIGIG